MPRIVYGGDRYLAVRVLEFLILQGIRPLGLMLPPPTRASHSEQLRALCPDLPESKIWTGTAFKSSEALEQLRGLDLDYIVCVHFCLIVPRSVLTIPHEGVLNLHPAYLPYSRGWNTSAWAILEKKPFGATLHFMSEQLDMGDIVHQKQIEIAPEDTGDTLYRKGMEVEFEVFKEAWPMLASKSYRRKPQHAGGTSHKVRDLEAVKEIDTNSMVRAGDLIDRLRALTTNKPGEASYIVANGRRYRLQLQITPEPAESSSE